MADQDPMVVAPSDGVVRGDSGAMPNRGTSSGFTHVGNDTYGADVSQGANNTRGSAHLAPDPADMCCPPGGGDFVGRNPHAGNPGASITGATQSDAADDTTPGDEGTPGDRD